MDYVYVYMYNLGNCGPLHGNKFDFEVTFSKWRDNVKVKSWYRQKEHVKMMYSDVQ